MVNQQNNQTDDVMMVGSRKWCFLRKYSKPFAQKEQIANTKSDQAIRTSLGNFLGQ
jgi:hypothetical protein